MTPSNSMCTVPNYGSSASYCDLPTEEQIRAGVVPLDSLPAAWWNAMWACTNGEVNKARDMLGQLIVELNNVLCNAGVCACSSCTDQLYQSINKIRQTLANASVAGAVKSSSQPSEVAVDANGYMSVNCLGNAASLTTSASTVVGAINELKSTYDTCWSNNTTALSGKAPTSHASSSTTYGVGSAGDYGHLKISDTYTSVLSACSGVAASQKAMACVYAVASAAFSGNIALGNSAGCALGTAAAGTATTAARSDHVHPKQTCVACAGANGSGTAFGSAATCAASAFLAASGCAADSVKLNGYSSDTAATNNTIARRQANGYLYATYFNQSSEAETATTSSCFMYANSDGFLRKTSVATVKTVLGLGSAAYCAVKTLTAKGDSGYNGHCAACQNLLVTTGFMSYWNGAFNSSGNSNLTYFCGGTFGSAAACAATAFRSCTWYPDDIDRGSVCCAYCATRAVAADYADGAGSAVCASLSYTWNGRSACSNNCFCVCYNSGTNGGVLCNFCNKTTNKLLIASVYNACVDSPMQLILPPGYKSSCAMYCMTGGTSCVRVILF